MFEALLFMENTLALLFRKYLIFLTLPWCRKLFLWHLTAILAHNCQMTPLLQLSFQIQSSIWNYSPFRIRGLGVIFHFRFCSEDDYTLETERNKMSCTVC